jgi:predicted Fe-Mo cluster-binding NifX family protein
MMNELKEKLHTEQCTLVVLHEGNISTFDGRGVRKLYNLVNDEPELFLDAKIADKAIGRTAARMMVQGGVVEVYADVISEQAYNTLKDAGIKVSYNKKVDHQTFLKIWEKLGEPVD